MRWPTALHDAAMYSGKEIMNLLISYGADVNARDEHQSTPLHQAAMLNNIEAAKALVEHGADIFAKNYHDYSKPLPEGMLLTPRRGNMNKTAKEIALAARPGDKYKELAQYLQTKEDEKEKKRKKKRKSRRRKIRKIKKAINSPGHEWHEVSDKL